MVAWAACQKLQKLSEIITHPAVFSDTTCVRHILQQFGSVRWWPRKRTKRLKVDPDRGKTSQNKCHYFVSMSYMTSSPVFCFRLAKKNLAVTKIGLRLHKRADCGFFFWRVQLFVCDTRLLNNELRLKWTGLKGNYALFEEKQLGFPLLFTPAWEFALSRNPSILRVNALKDAIIRTV